MLNKSGTDVESFYNVSQKMRGKRHYDNNVDECANNSATSRQRASSLSRSVPRSRCNITNTKYRYKQCADYNHLRYLESGPKRASSSEHSSNSINFKEHRRHRKRRSNSQSPSCNILQSNRHLSSTLCYKTRRRQQGIISEKTIHRFRSRSPSDSSITRHAADLNNTCNLKQQQNDIKNDIGKYYPSNKHLLKGLTKVERSCSSDSSSIETLKRPQAIKKQSLSVEQDNDSDNHSVPPLVGVNDSSTRLDLSDDLFEKRVARAVAIKIEKEVQKRVEQILQSPEFLKDIEDRLQDERLKLEKKMQQQLENEKNHILETFKQQEVEKKLQSQKLEEILIENDKKIKEQQRRLAEEQATRNEERLKELEKIQQLKKEAQRRQLAEIRLNTPEVHNSAIVHKSSHENRVAFKIKKMI